ncbi:hypothetical protein [Kitasatospora sp. NPDC004289]
MRSTPGPRVRSTLAALGALVLGLTTAGPAGAATGAPAVPTDLYSGNRACAADPAAATWLNARSGVSLMGIPSHPDTAELRYLGEEFEYWPVADPARTTTLVSGTVPNGREGSVVVQPEALTEGQTYAWRSRTVAGGESSAWTAPCHFVVDNTRPAAPPVISSSNYPADTWSPGGLPVEITLDPAGVDDVAGYQFSWVGSLPVVGGFRIGERGIPTPIDSYETSTSYLVRAAGPGRPTTVRLLPPHGSGPMRLTVASLDRTWTRSAATSEYSFYVNSTAPQIRQLVADPQWGETVPFKITANPDLPPEARVTEYSVEIYDGRGTRKQTVKPSATGNAIVHLPLNGQLITRLSVSSTSANGWVSNQNQWTSPATDTTPTVTSQVYPENDFGGGVGVTGTFFLAPKVPGVTSYLCTFDGRPPVTVPAAADGTARLDWAPEYSDLQGLNVTPVLADGLQLDSYYYSFWVA